VCFDCGPRKEQLHGDQTGGEVTSCCLTTLHSSFFQFFKLLIAIMLIQFFKLLIAIMLNQLGDQVNVLTKSFSF